MTKYNKFSYKSKSAEERKQEIDNAMQLVEQGVKEFLTSEKYAAVLKSISKFHNYSFNNTMLIMMQCPAASYVASYPSWKKNFNRFVTSGAKGIKIFVPVEYKIYKDKVDPETKEPIVDDKGNHIKEYSGQKGLSFKIGNVFDISQTQQIEGLQHVFPLGWNNIQFQRNLTSEATAINVPFNSKDLMHPYSIFYGQNLISRNPIFCDRKQLLNGNGVILATAGAGKSFSCKSNIEQIFMRYPNDHIIVIDPQNEYKPIIEKFHGQTINISASSGTRINPFDLSLNYGLTDEESNNPVKSKTEYIIAFIESIVGGNGLTGIQKTIIDRCCRIVYEKFELSGFTDLSLQPNFKDFYDVMNEQPEEEAKNLALVLERYVLGSMDIFSKDTNVDIHNRFVCFDISELQTSMQTTGYLVVLDHIMNRLAMNKKEGNYTWLFIDEFHILLQNEFSAQYIAKIYKVGRKLGAMNTVITQNITDVLNNEQGQKILSNSEFALLLKQKPLDLAQLSQIFDISKEEGDYITDSSVGKGLLVYGSESVLPFEFKVPKNTEIYRLNETSMISQSR